MAAESATARIENSYDFQGRRARRKSYTGTPQNWTLSEHLVYVYDDWNLIRELDDMGDDITLRNHIWGLDLSGTLQGAGGVGGLLATENESDIYFVTYDANGSISEYIDSTGNIASHTEYDPFGNATVLSGEDADVLAFRFSTKYLDAESDSQPLPPSLVLELGSLMTKNGSARRTTPIIDASWAWRCRRSAIN